MSRDFAASAPIRFSRRFSKDIQEVSRSILPTALQEFVSRLDRSLSGSYCLRVHRASEMKIKLQSRVGLKLHVCFISRRHAIILCPR